MTGRPQVIMVHPDEYADALEAGWLPEDIVRPTIVQVEGLRWEAMHVTWKALEVICNSRIMDRIEADQVRFDSIITIGYIKSKNPVRMIKDFTLNSINIHAGPNAFGETIQVKERT